MTSVVWNCIPRDLSSAKCSSDASDAPPACANVLELGPRIAQLLYCIRVSSAKASPQSITILRRSCIQPQAESIHSSPLKRDSFSDMSWKAKSPDFHQKCQCVWSVDALMTIGLRQLERRGRASIRFHPRCVCRPRSHLMYVGVEAAFFREAFRDNSVSVVIRGPCSHKEASTSGGRAPPGYLINAA